MTSVLLSLAVKVSILIALLVEAAAKFKPVRLRPLQAATWSSNYRSLCLFLRANFLAQLNTCELSLYGSPVWFYKANGAAISVCLCDIFCLPCFSPPVSERYPCFPSCFVQLASLSSKFTFKPTPNVTRQACVLYPVGEL